MVWLLLSLLVGQPRPASQSWLKPGPWVGLGQEALGRELAALHAAEPSYVGRLLKISKRFVGAPYRFSPLGEGEGHPPDPDPAFTDHEFDCLSLVEISMALAATPDLERALSLLREIRYSKGEATFAARKHLMEAQWIPENLAQGWIEDVTRQVGGELAVAVSKRLSPEIFKKRKKAAELDLPPERIPTGTFRWWALPLDTIEQVAARLPSGALIFVVRQDYQSIPFRISHVGIVVQKRQGTYLRHAKDQGVHAVIDMPLADVVKRHTEFIKWPVTGFSVYLPRMPAS